MASVADQLADYRKGCVTNTTTHQRLQARTQQRLQGRLWSREQSALAATDRRSHAVQMAARLMAEAMGGGAIAVVELLGGLNLLQDLREQNDAQDDPELGDWAIALRGTVVDMLQRQLAAGVIEPAVDSPVPVYSKITYRDLVVDTSDVETAAASLEQHGVAVVEAVVPVDTCAPLGHVDHKAWL